MAYVYEYHTLTGSSHQLIIDAVQAAIPKARGMTAERLRELLGLLCNAHQVVLKNKHMRAA